MTTKRKSILLMLILSVVGILFFLTFNGKEDDIPPPEIETIEETYTIYFPISFNHPPSNLAGWANAHGLSADAANNLGMSNWYNYSLRPSNRHQQQYFMFWCLEYISPSGNVTNYLNELQRFHSSEDTFYLLYINEWGYTDQCQNLSEREYVDTLAWIIDTYPNAKIIVGNMYGHDSLRNHRRLEYALRLIDSDNRIQWSDIYGISIHDYTLTNPEPPIEKLHDVLSKYNIGDKPLFVTEFTADKHHLEDYLNYYMKNNIRFFYFAPCNPLDEFTLIERETISTTPENGLPWDVLDCSGSELSELGEIWFETITRTNND